VSKGIVVRYRTTPNAAEENEQLVRDVYRELAERRPDGFHYITLRLDDGVSFVHVALQDDDAENPLPELPAFARFQACLAERLAEGPQPSPASVVGSYAFPAGDG
jgi:hypothetical protein